MAITKRGDKGSSLTYNEMDDNFEAIAPRTSADGAIQIPAGGTGQRPSPGAEGQLRFNTASKLFEGFQGTVWTGLGSGGGGGGGTPGSQGVQGFTGAGTQGTTGLGLQGAAGTDGEDAAQGTQGFIGESIQGPAGSSQGVQGFLGVGLQGAAGTIGNDGPIGPTGIQGLQGFKGDDGDAGGDGPQGTTGSGVQGLQGQAGTIQGLQGTSGIGNDGQPGQAGPQGITGTGIQGLQGTTGDTGPSGFGSQGIQGVQGDVGQDGADGGAGTQGTIGLQGIQGENGFQGFQGTLGLQGQTGAGNQGTQGTEGFGGTGAQGLQGFTGAGTAGIDGDDGQDGSQGTQGFQGAAGQDGVSVQGFTGTQGLIGAGVQGPAGSVQGLQGTEGNSTQGTQGLIGVGVQGAAGSTQGIQGLQGNDAQQGTQGFAGSLGNQGDQGIQGPNGTDGDDGLAGNQGVQGTFGLQGLQGTTGTGIQGIAGELQGVQGLLGNSGSSGAQGIQGLDGPIGAISNLVEDTTPQLGGVLDLNGWQITHAGDIVLNPTSTNGHVGISSTTATGGKIMLNHDQTGTPATSATNHSYITVNRGTSTDVSVRWNEVDDKWQFTNDGSTYYDFVTADTDTGILNVIEDTTPQLGGDLDVNSNKITAIGTYGEIPIEVNINSVATEIVKFGYDPVNPTTPVAARYGTTFTDKVWIDANQNQQFDLYDVVTDTADITSDAGIYMNFKAIDGTSNEQLRASFYHQNGSLKIESFDQDAANPITNYLQLVLTPTISNSAFKLTSVVNSVATNYNIVSEYNADAIIAAKTDYFANPIRFYSRTTTERDALTGMTDGDMVWNSTTDKINTYDGSAWTEVGGGGGADLYAANESSPAAQPSATGANAIAIGDGAISSSEDGIAIGLDATHTTVHGTSKAISIGANTVADYYSTAIGAGTPSNKTTASGNSSLALGYTAQATGTLATAIGKSYASGTGSFAAAIDNNTSSYGALGANSIAMGSLAKASVANGIAIGKDTLVDGGADGISLGRNARAGNNAISIGQTGWGGGQSYAQGQASISIGQNNLAQQVASVVLGIHGHSNTVGKYVYSSGYLGGQGNAQTGTFILIGNTTDATAKALGTNTSTLSSTNQIVLPNNSCYGFTGTVIAREQASATDDFAVWEIKGGAVRAASASTTALGSYNINKISESTGATNWSIALSADTTNGAIAITVTGEASHNIRWVATVNTTEVTY